MVVVVGDIVPLEVLESVSKVKVAELWKTPWFEKTNTHLNALATPTKAKLKKYILFYYLFTLYLNNILLHFQGPILCWNRKRANFQVSLCEAWTRTICNSWQLPLILLYFYLVKCIWKNWSISKFDKHCGSISYLIPAYHMIIFICSKAYHYQTRYCLGDNTSVWLQECAMVASKLMVEQRDHKIQI